MPYAPISLAAPIALSPDWAAIVGRVHRAKPFVFLRQPRHVLFADDTQQGKEAA